MPVIDLLPCPTPWCRKPIGKGGPYMTRLSDGSRVRCDSCGVTGPKQKTRAAAAAAWNDGRNRTVEGVTDCATLIEVARRGIEAGIARARSGVGNVAGHELLVERFLAERQ